MDDELEKILRDCIGYRKGALGKALSEGAKLWIDKNSKKSSLDRKNSKKSKPKVMKK